MKRVAEEPIESKSSDQKKGKHPRSCDLADKLYFNKITGLSEHHNSNAFSLAELLEIIKPVASIHFNYMIDPSWLLMQYPQYLRGKPITLIVGEKMGTNIVDIKNAVRECGVDNISVGRARLVVPFGTHHSKMSLFESNNGKVHIIISTANLLKHDWEFKTQAFFHCSGVELAENSSTEGGTNFKGDLVEYIEEYRSSREWNLIEYWRDRIANIDLSHVKARIIYSVPGYHKGFQSTKYGHPRLRTVLKELFGNATNYGFTYHAQFSSIGTLGKTAEHWLTSQFLCSLAGGNVTDGSQLRIIFPCVEDVRNSNEGYSAGGSLPYLEHVANKQPYLIHFMYKWRSDHLGRSRAMPHIKTYAAFANNSSKPLWLLVTSANLSKAAWGEYQCKEAQLAIRSYELGLLFTDLESLDMLPYDMPLTKYGPNDQIWIANKVYTTPDMFQRTWP